MGLKTKLRTLLDPEKRLRSRYETERRSANAARGFPLTPEGVLQGLDMEKLDAIRSRFAINDPGIRVQKYLDFETWFTTNIRRVLNIGLDFKHGKRILDLGVGAGYFLYTCKRLGHDPQALDMEDPTVPWYGDLLQIFGVPRLLWRIDPFVPLPDLGAPFDYVCSFMVCFNRHLSPDVWTPKEWAFFLDDLWTRLRPGAVVWLELNPSPDGVTHYTPELKQFFQDRGAIVDGKRLVWGMQELQYRILLDEGRREAARMKKNRGKV